MKKLMIGLICAALFSSCSKDDKSNNSKPGGGGGRGGAGGGVLDLNQPKSTSQFPTEANAIINWEINLIGRSEYINFLGKTTNNLPCVLSLTDSYPSISPKNLVYLSLGTGATPSTKEDQYTWIGTFIGPDVGYHELVKTSNQVRFSKTQTEVDPDFEIWNVLTVDLDSRGLPIKATGQSSHWPSSTCILN